MVLCALKWMVFQSIKRSVTGRDRVNEHTHFRGFFFRTCATIAEKNCALNWHVWKQLSRRLTSSDSFQLLTCLFAKTNRTASRSSSSDSILFSSSLASPTRSRSLLSTTKMRPSRKQPNPTVRNSSIYNIPKLICKYPAYSGSSDAKAVWFCPVHRRPTLWNWCSCTLLSRHWNLRNKIQPGRSSDSNKRSSERTVMAGSLRHFTLPIVGMVVTISPSFSLYRIVVLRQHPSPPLGFSFPSCQRGSKITCQIHSPGWSCGRESNKLRERCHLSNI